MADKKKTIIELLKNLESTLKEIYDADVNDEESLKKILKDFCMKFNNDVTDTNELEGLIKNINLILGRIVDKYSKISEDAKTQAASAEDPKTQAEDAKTQAVPPPEAGSSIAKPADAVSVMGGKKRKTKNKKTKKHKKRRTKKLKKKKSKKYRKVNTKKH
jgi:hypothetical protein